MTEYSLQDAAKYIGVPANSLHAAAWAGNGPKSNGSYWHPTFTKDALDEWLARIKQQERF